MYGQLRVSMFDAPTVCLPTAHGDINSKNDIQEKWRVHTKKIALTATVFQITLTEKIYI